MPGQPFPLGPWSGGMADVSEEATIADDELSLVVNMDQDIDGSLVSRPAIVLDSSGPGGLGADLDISPLGYYVRDDGITFLVAAVETYTYLYNIDTKVWTQIWTTAATSFVQYDNKVVLISDAVAGGYWEAGVFTSTPTMPLGSQIVFYQDRFWAFGKRGTGDATTVWFSKLTVISPPSSIFTWAPTTDFFTVSEGDGEWITALVPDTSALLIFRNSSTYQFTFPSAPSSGTLRVLSKTIGAENAWAVVAYENYYLAFSAGFLYQFINYRFYPLNVKKIAFKRTTLVNALLFNIRVSIFGRRVLVWFYGSLYVYKLVTATWSTWDSPLTRAAQFLTIPPSSQSGESRVALAVSGENNATLKVLYRIEENVLGTGSGELMTCHVRTKAYNFGEPAQYKRLMWWAIESRSSTGVDAIAHPVALPDGGTTWNDMEGEPWSSFGTWNNPLIQLVTYEDDVAFPAAAPVSTVTKIRAPIRFLSLLFEVFLTTYGTTATGPARIYGITPYLLIESGISRKVS